MAEIVSLYLFKTASMTNSKQATMTTLTLFFSPQSQITKTFLMERPCLVWFTLPLSPLISLRNVPHIRSPNKAAEIASTWLSKRCKHCYPRL
jgi:hypothetical protein